MNRLGGRWGAWSRSTPRPASWSARSRRSRRTRSRGSSTTSPGSSPPGPSCRSKTAAATCARPPRSCSTTSTRSPSCCARAGQAARRGLHDGAAADGRRPALVRQAGPKILADEKVRMSAGLPAQQEAPLLLRADRRRRRDRALELPLVDPLRRGRDRADGRQRRRPQAGQPDAAAGRGDPPRLREGRPARGPGPRRPRRRRGRRRARQLERRQGLLHRLGRGRPQGRRGLRRASSRARCSSSAARTR